MSLDFYNRCRERVPDVVVAVWLVLAILTLGWMLVAAPDAFCDSCPPGSRGSLVRGIGGPRCICEVSR